MSSVSTITTEFNRIGIDKSAESSTSINGVGGGGGGGSTDNDHEITNHTSNNSSSSSNGNIIITSNSNESKLAHQQKHDYLVVDVPLGLIQRIEKLNSNSTFEFIGIMISCKVRVIHNLCSYLNHGTDGWWLMVLVGQLLEWSTSQTLQSGQRSNV